MLIVLGGRPATGKTTIARELARRIRATHLSIDAIEQALRASGSLRDEVGSAGHLVAQALAEDMLRLGQVVIADAVHGREATREAWRAVAARADVPLVEIEIARVAAADPRARVEAYEAWTQPHVVVDTSGRTVEQSTTEAVAALQRY